MTYRYTEAQQEIRDTVLRICADFDDEYWLEKDRNGGFPHDLHKALADGGWLGIALPEEVGGAGLGITEAAIMMQAIAESGGGASGASAIHMNIFGLNPVVKFGTPEQKQRMLVPLLEGREKACFAVTEPTTGLDFNRAGGSQDAVVGPHHAAGRGYKAHRGVDPVLHDAGPDLCGRARDRKNGPQSGRFQ
jgi:acyl-CoA dehydrogenase